jgi:hypothetical protein
MIRSSNKRVFSFGMIQSVAGNSFHAFLHEPVLLSFDMAHIIGIKSLLEMLLLLYFHLSTASFLRKQNFSQ